MRRAKSMYVHDVKTQNYRYVVLWEAEGKCCSRSQQKSSPGLWLRLTPLLVLIERVWWVSHSLITSALDIWRSTFHTPVVQEVAGPRDICQAVLAAILPIGVVQQLFECLPQSLPDITYWTKTWIQSVWVPKTMPRRKHNKLLLGKISKLLVVGLTYRLWRNNKISKRKKSNIKYSYNGSRQHMACSFMPACLRCRTLVDTIVLLYELCCSVQGRLKAVIFCLRYVDTAVWQSELGLCLRGVRRRRQVRKPKLRGCLWSSCILRIWQSELMIQQALSKKSTSPAVMFTSPLVLPGATTWLGWEERLCRELATLTHTRACAFCCCCYDVAVLLRLVVVQHLLMLLLLA